MAVMHGYCCDMKIREYISEPKIASLTSVLSELGKDSWEAVQKYQKPIIITLSVAKKKRSLNQNSYYWGSIIPAFAKVLEKWGNDTELTSNPDYVHEVIKTSGIFKSEWELLVKSPKGERKLRTTTKLNTQEFTEFVERIIRICAENGVYVEAPPQHNN